MPQTFLTVSGVSRPYLGVAFEPEASLSWVDQATELPDDSVSAEPRFAALPMAPQLGTSSTDRPYCPI